MNNLQQKLIEMYIQEMTRKHCLICEDEAKQIRSDGGVKVGPKTLFHVGDSFEHRRFRPVFVGKTDWYNLKQWQSEEPISTHGKIIKNTFGQGTEWYKDDGGVAFWRYIKEITQEINLSLDDYAVSNLAKCDVMYKYAKEKYKEDTPLIMYQKCTKIFNKEMQILRPTHIIFFTNEYFDDLIHAIRFWFDDYSYYQDIKESYYIKQITNSYKVKKRNRTACWWHRSFYYDSSRKKPELQFLRTRHPQGAPGKFKEKIIEWLEENK